MKLLKPILIYFCGIFSAAIFYWLSPNYGSIHVYRENMGLYVKAHMYCFEEIIANWAQQDSVYIPLDSLEDVYIDICGVKVDSIAGK